MNRKLIKVNTPFIDEISRLARVKILDYGTHSTLVLKLKFIQKNATLDITNKGTNTMIFKPEEMIGIIDLRSLGYYKIKQGILQQNLSRYYRFKRAEKLCEHFNNFVNHSRRKESKTHLETNIHGWTKAMRKDTCQTKKY